MPSVFNEEERHSALTVKSQISGTVMAFDTLSDLSHSLCSLQLLSLISTFLHSGLLSVPTLCLLLPRGTINFFLFTYFSY